MTSVPPEPNTSSTQISAIDYMSQRVDDQIAWYSTKSDSCQWRHKLLRMIEIVAAALIPFLSGVGDAVPYGPWVIGFLGVLIAVLTASSGTFNFRENWLHYRATSEQLRHEKFLFLTRVAPYSNTDAFQLLVQRIEWLISKENSTWTQTFKSPTRTNNNAKSEAG